MLVCYPRTPMYTPELGDLSLLMLILTTGVSSTLLHTQSIGPIRDIAGGKPIRPHITTQISQCRKKIDIINRSTHFYVHWRVYSRDRQKGRKSKSERQRAGDKVQSTHTLQTEGPPNRTTRHDCGSCRSRFFLPTTWA